MIFVIWYSQADKLEQLNIKLSLLVCSVLCNAVVIIFISFTLEMLHFTWMKKQLESQAKAKALESLVFFTSK